MDETIDELKAGWEAVREKVNALQLTAQFYAERNQQLIDAARINGKIIADLSNQLHAKDELLWWLTAEAERFPNMYEQIRQLLATQGYTREGLEKR